MSPTGKSVRVGPDGLTVGEVDLGWGEYAAECDPLRAAAKALLGASNPRIAHLDRSTIAALLAARRVLADAPPPRVLVVTTEDGSTEADRTFWQTARADGGAYASPMLFPATLPSAAAGEISMTFGLRGPCIVLAGEGASSAADVIAVPGGGGRLTVRLLRGGVAVAALDDRRS